MYGSELVSFFFVGRVLPRYFALQKSNLGWPAYEPIPSLINESFLSRGIFMGVLGVNLFWYGEGDRDLLKAEGDIM